MNWTRHISKTAGLCRSFVSDESASTAVEYSIIAAGVGGAIIAIVMALGTNVKTKLYDTIANVL